MSMTLEQAIEHAEEVAIEQAYLMGRYDAASGYARSGNESIRTESAKECEKCAAEHRQLAVWLRELKERRNEPEERTEERTETHVCDLISRQAAIDALDCIGGVEEVLRSLPSAQPERKKGEWVQIRRSARDAQPDLECPFCKHRIGWFDMGRYCAGCGAKLKGGAG